MVSIDFQAWETEAWLRGIRELLDTISRTVSEAEAKEAEALRRLAHEQEWERDDYRDELDALEDKFQHWLPRLSSYSVIVLLHSLVETQLFEYAERLRRSRGYELDVRDLRGRGVEQAKAYITKVAGVTIGSDPGWQQLSNLQQIRNIIVHRRGRRGASGDQERTVNRLLSEYPETLKLSDASEDGEVLPSFPLCLYFINQVESFFHRLCRAAGFQERSVM